LRIVRILVAAGVAAATATALSMAPAMAEPINPHTGKSVLPSAYDIVGVGSESISYVVDQLTYNYDKADKANTPATPYIYSWDAVPPNNLNDTTQMITVKAGCKKNLRPDGSSAGITDMFSYGNTSYTYKGKKHTVPCIDFARSSRPRKSSDPRPIPGGAAFVQLAQDAVTYASTNLKGESTNVPDNLTFADLAEIFGCTVPAAHGFKPNTWGALLGAKAKGASDAIDPIAPQAGSGTLSFWMETALGLPTDTEPTCGTAATLPTASQPEENEGISKVFLLKNGKPNPNVIYPFSVGAYVSQEFHSAKCGVKPKTGQNSFGCNETGVFGLNGINYKGVVYAPTVTVKGVGVTNPAWRKTAFERTLYDVVRWTSGTVQHIPGYLEKFLGPKGYFCGQGKVLAAYGFEPFSGCGVSD
jgi:ABC-type phosphate transport system substrate-binding protein